MRSVKPMQTAKIGYFIMSAVFCAVGILLILFPQMSAYTLCQMLGAILVLYGAIKMIGYFSRDLYRLAFQYDLAFGMLIMLIGLILLAVPGRAMSFLFIVLGILILTDGLFKIQISLDARRFGIRKWWLIFSLAVLSGILGLLLVIRPAESMQFIMALLGISLLCDGILSFCVALLLVKIIRNQHPDVIEIDYSELGKD